MDNKKILITTALEQSWITNENVVFLGKWCTRLNNKKKCNYVNYLYHPNHWDDRSKLKNDHEYLYRLHNKLLEELTRNFNNLFGINKNIKFWQTILDPWLLTYTAVVFDRWESLRVAFNNNDAQYFTIGLSEPEFNPPFFDYKHFINNILLDEWNHIIFLKIIKSEYLNQCNILYVEEKLNFSKLEYTSNKTSGLINNIKKLFFYTVDFISKNCIKKHEIIFFNTYFPIASLFKLNLKLNQFPRFYDKIFEFPFKSNFPNSIDISIRNKISIKLTPQNKFESFLFKQIILDIPITNIEMFEFLYQKTNYINLKPRLIISANSHWDNVLFKIWLADRTSKGVKFISMEHGGGLTPTMSSMNFEEEISDYKITWIKAFNPKQVRLTPSKLISFKKVVKYGKNLSLIGFENTPYNYRIESSPKNGQIEVHNKFVCVLYENLNINIKNKLKIRPYPNQGWNTKEFFEKKIGAEKISNIKSFKKFIYNSKIVVCTYPQTTFTESLISGIPVILLYPKDYWETIPELNVAIEKFIEAKIIFSDPLIAASHINEVWDNPNVWWESEQVKIAKEYFLNNLLKFNKKPLDEWSCFIKSII